jgi:hypothetical protein
MKWMIRKNNENYSELLQYLIYLLRLVRLTKAEQFIII